MDCWHREIQRSRTEAEVVGSARDFLALWSPRELGWRNARIETAADIERVKRWAVEELGGELSELGDYFWHAAVRIRELRGG
jgi:hypothetical protein